MADASRILEALLRLTTDLTDDRPLEECLTVVTESSLELLGADHASVRLLDGSGTILIAGARAGTGELDPPMDFRRGEGIIGWVVANGAPARVEDVTADLRWKVGAAQSFVVRSIAAEPLWSGGQVIGVLAVTSPDVGRFTEQDQLYLRLLANCSAVPVERARLRRLAMFDDVTMAFDARYFAPRLVEEMERASRASADLSVLCVELDAPESVRAQKDTRAFDGLLRQVADRVRRTIRRVDVLARVAPARFGVIMPQTGATQAHGTATRIQQAFMSEPFDVDGQRVRQTVSIGAATWDRHESPERLDERAVAACLEAQRQGRNRVIVAVTR